MDGWCDIVKTLGCLFAKRGHGKVDFAIVILLVKVDFDVFFPGGVYGNIKVLFEGVNEMNCIIP